MLFAIERNEVVTHANLCVDAEAITGSKSSQVPRATCWATDGTCPGQGTLKTEGEQEEEGTGRGCLMAAGFHSEGMKMFWNEQSTNESSLLELCVYSLP